MQRICKKEIWIWTYLRQINAQFVFYNYYCVLYGTSLYIYAVLKKTNSTTYT